MNRDITVSSIETGPYCVNTYFVRLNNSDECVIIDPADAGKVNTYLEKNGLGCNAILLTHCHFDHMLGVPELQKQGLFPVGRLDKDTTGLLLLTTDGELNHRLLAPARHVDKTYLATLDKPVGDKEVAVFASGLSLSDFEAAPADLTPLPDNQARVTIHEGKFHQVKRMFAAVEREVLTLHRETFGSLVLDEALPCGQWRELTEAEASALYRDAQMEEKHG